MEKQGARLRFAGIELMGKQILERPEGATIAPSTESFNFDIIAESKISPEEKRLIVKTTIKVSEIGKEIILASFVTLCAFHVENFDESILKIDDANYEIPIDADVVIKSVSVSTTRGIMYSEVRGTFLYNMVLPIIIFNPEQIMSQQKKEQDVPLK
jgi:hypothetical protein